MRNLNLGLSRYLRFVALPLAVLLVCVASAQPAKDSPKYLFDQTKAWDHLMWQCDLGPRPPETDAHIKCRDRLKDEMAKYCANVHFQEFSHTWSSTGKKVTMWNVIGDQNWEKAKVRVVLMAHWDTRPTSDEEQDPQLKKLPIIGANDGASEVAVLLELMRVLKEKNNPDVGVMYVMDDGEDLGPGDDEMYLGAIAFANNLQTPRPDYGILLDMVGTQGVRIAMETEGLALCKPLIQSFYRYAQEQGFGKTFPGEMGTAVIDDHLSVNKAGVPMMDLIDFEHLDHWHNQTDTAKYCSPESLGEVGRMLEAWLTKKSAFHYPKKSQE